MVSSFCLPGNVRSEGRHGVLPPLRSAGTPVEKKTRQESCLWAIAASAVN
ncbi:hypothetical protein [Microcoleus sp. D2_18a_D3]